LVIEKQELAIGFWLLALSKFGDWASWLLKSIRGEGKPALWLGLRPQEIWAEQIPPSYSHPATRKNRSHVGDPGTRGLMKAAARFTDVRDNTCCHFFKR